MNKKLLVGAIVLSIVAIVLAVGNRGKVVERVVGALSGPNVYDSLFFWGGQTNARVNATTSSVATYTLTADDVASNAAFFDTVIFTKTGAVADVTWTLPASSTVKALPQAGMRSSICFRNATTTAGSELILAEGTGFGIEAATSTTAVGAGLRTIAGDTTVCGTIVREEADVDSFDLTLILNPISVEGQ